MGRDVGVASERERNTDESKREGHRLMGRFDEFEEREKIAGAEAIGSGGFSKHLMERSGLLLYASQVGKGKARIVIEYDNDTGKGMIGVFKYSPIPTDQTDMGNCIAQRQENAKNAQGAGKEKR